MRLLLRTMTGKRQSAEKSRQPRWKKNKSTLDCRQYNYLRWLSWNAGKEVERVFKCDYYQHIIHMWCWRWLLSGTFEVPETATQTRSSGSKSSTGSQPEAADSQAAVSEYIIHNATFWQTATLKLSVFTTFILPMM